MTDRSPSTSAAKLAQCSPGHLADPGSPCRNAWVESFNGRLRDELLNAWRFDSLLEARVIIEDWRLDYNANRPHSGPWRAPPPSSLYSGPRPTNPKSHSDWTTDWFPLKRIPIRSASQR